MSGDCSYVGQVCNLRRVFNPPSAGPGKILGARTQSGGHGIILDLVRDAVELDGVSHPAVVGFVLPEGLAGDAEHFVSFFGRKSFQGVHHIGNIHVRRDQQMDVIPHHDIIMQDVPTISLQKANRADHHFGKFRAGQVHRTAAARIEQPVHGNESFSVGGDGRKSAIRRHGSCETPRKKDWMTNRREVRQPADVESWHEDRVQKRSDSSHKAAGRLKIGRRLETCPTTFACPNKKIEGPVNA